MPRSRRARARRSPWPRLAAAVLLALAAGTAWLIASAERKLRTLALGGLGESFPTRIWSAPFALRAGSLVETGRLLERLTRLGYVRVDGEPALGQYRWSSPELDVYLRGYDAPGSSQDPGLYALRRGGGGRWSLRGPGGDPVPAVRLEPELASVLSGSRSVRREPMTWAQIPRPLADAAIAAEDKRFWTHWGLDPRAMLRALWADARGRDLQGASTITQQLAKNLFLSPRRTIGRKIEEAALALYLERRLGKRRILTLYLNDIYMGQDGASSVMGMRAASRYYFGKDPAGLTLAEDATLAGMIRGPGFYDPRREPEASRRRRDQVLNRMRDDGLIGEAALRAALAEPLKAAPAAPPPRAADDAYYVAEVVRELLPRYGGDALYRDGLTIYTAMDPVLQSAAQKAARASRHQAALVALDPATGDVLALVGGKDFALSQFNRATQARRQPGSAFKPFVYAAALRAGLTPATILLDRPRAYPGANGRSWRPGNYDGVYMGTVTMRTALAHSLNAASLDLASRVGVPAIEKTARDCGIESPLSGDLGMALGDSGVSLLELVSAYEPFADGGLRPPPRLVTAVLDSAGGVLEEPPPEAKIALDPATAYLTASLMESVVKDGTARSLKAMRFDVPAAGKTGTTNDGRDAWFVGFTSSFLAGAWVGDDRDRALKLTGAKDALPLWERLASAALADRPAEEFARPPGVVAVRLCADSHLLARSGCPGKYDEVFRAGTAPTQFCPLHRGGIMGWLERLTAPR
ncbi:MAG: PBP1A family penicillin-binding protein [Elusimicrobia bacterium]|nr:PBP1A family penicillin-binding protein [Elusimicrobiota bacterium]